MNKRIIFIILLVLLAINFIAFIFMYNRNNTLSSTITLHEGINDSLMIYKNKYGESVTQIKTLQAENTQQFTELVFKDSLIIQLQTLVKENQYKLRNHGSATIFKTITKIDTLVQNQAIRDSLIRYSNDWISMNLTLLPNDSIDFHLEVKNEYSIIIGEDRKTIFESYKPYAIVTNKNPFTNTVALRTYEVKVPKPKRFGLGISGGITYDFIHKHTIPYIGIGINYNVIEF